MSWGSREGKGGEGAEPHFQHPASWRITAPGSPWKGSGRETAEGRDLAWVSIIGVRSNPEPDQESYALSQAGPLPCAEPRSHLTRDPREAQTLPGGLASLHELPKPLAYAEP